LVLNVQQLAEAVTLAGRTFQIPAAATTNTQHEIQISAYIQQIWKKMQQIAF